MKRAYTRPDGSKSWSNTWFDRLHIYISNNVSWKQGLRFQIAPHNTYPHYGRDKVESGERLFYWNDYYVLTYCRGARGITIHWYNPLPTKTHSPKKWRTNARRWFGPEREALL